SALELGFHAQQLVAFVLIDRGHRDAGPLRHDLVDLGLADDDLAGVRFDVELLPDELQVLARGDFLFAVELRLLEVFLRDGVFHLLDGHALVGRSTLMAWHRRSSDRSFSMYLRYSAGVVAPMQRISPRLSAGFRMLAASSDPSAEPAPTRVCSSSMKTMMLGLSVSSFMIALRRSSN